MSQTPNWGTDVVCMGDSLVRSAGEELPIKPGQVWARRVAGGLGSWQSAGLSVPFVQWKGSGLAGWEQLVDCIGGNERKFQIGDVLSGVLCMYEYAFNRRDRGRYCVLRRAAAWLHVACVSVHVCTYLSRPGLAQNAAKICSIHPLFVRGT